MKVVKGKHVARWTGEVRLVPEKLDDPLRWKKPRYVFVDSMFDVFHRKIPDDYIARIFDVMAQTPHIYQVLTKRAQRMQQWFTSEACERVMGYCADNDIDWPLENVILVVSCEDQQRVDERVPCLLGTPAAYRGVSAEPLLERISLTMVKCPACHADGVDYCPLCSEAPHNEVCSNGYFDALQEGIDWVIVGCESGLYSRPMDTQWARELRNECVSHGVAFFYKQQKNAEGKVVKKPMLDGRQYLYHPTTMVNYE